MTEHSDQSKAAYAAQRKPISISDIPSPADAWMSGFDAALAERRITDRETVARTIWESAEARSERSPYSWEYLLGRAANGAAPGDYPEIRDTVYAQADAILALPSTPITSTREALVAKLFGHYHTPAGLCFCGHRYGGTPSTGAVIEHVADALLVSGLVKDNGDDSAVPRFETITDIWNRYGIDPVIAGRYTPQMIEAYEAGKRAPVDRLAVIREVIDWWANQKVTGGPGWVSKAGLDAAREHFGVAPVEEEA